MHRSIVVILMHRYCMRSTRKSQRNNLFLRIGKNAAAWKSLQKGLGDLTDCSNYKKHMYHAVSSPSWENPTCNGL